MSADDLNAFFAIEVDGTGLPHGKGTAATGKEIYAERCAHCHGENLEGSKELGGPRLIGGRGSLTTDKPLKTVESYWPHVSTLYDYMWRTMPFDQPGSLSPDDVYALAAYILSAGKIIDDKTEMNEKTLPKVVMPNANAFFDASGTTIDLYNVQPVAPKK